MDQGNRPGRADGRVLDGRHVIYGVAAGYPGALGLSVGWGFFQIFDIMGANVSGVLTGEWRAAPAGALRSLYAGLALLACATVILAAGSRQKRHDHRRGRAISRRRCGRN